MKIREVISIYKHWAESITGDNSDDSLSSDLAIYHMLIKSRSTVLKQALDGSTMIGEETYQTIPCIELQEVDRVECPTIPASGCIWLRSVCPLPDLIKIQTVATHFGEGYSYVRWDKIKEKTGGRLKSAAREKFYSLRTIKDEVYLYLYNEETIKNITVVGIFEDPAEASMFCKFDKEALCDPMDTSFHTPQYLIDAVNKATWDVTLRVRSQAKLKALNNDFPIDNTTQTPTQQK